MKSGNFPEFFALLVIRHPVGGYLVPHQLRDRTSQDFISFSTSRRLVPLAQREPFKWKALLRHGFAPGRSLSLRSHTSLTNHLKSNGCPHNF